MDNDPDMITQEDQKALLKNEVMMEILAKAKKEEVVIPQFPVEVLSAALKVQSGVQKIIKTNMNTFDKYKFVSIDDFYEMINPLLCEAGLFIFAQEAAHDRYINSKGTPFMRVLYYFFMIEETSGKTAGPFYRMVSVKDQAAQDYGAAESFATKQFLRHQFKIPTGEPDPEGNNTGRPAPQQQPRQAPKEKTADEPKRQSNEERAKAAADGVIKKLKAVSIHGGADRVWQENSEAVDKLEKFATATKSKQYDRVMEAYSEAVSRNPPPSNEEYQSEVDRICAEFGEQDDIGGIEATRELNLSAIEKLSEISEDFKSQLEEAENAARETAAGGITQAGFNT